MLQDRRNALAGIDILRKICNHPDLLQRRQWEGTEKYGNPVRSGKLVVALKVSAALSCPHPAQPSTDCKRAWASGEETPAKMEHSVCGSFGSASRPCASPVLRCELRSHIFDIGAGWHALS